MRCVSILGPGGVGGFIAAALARASVDVVVVAREETAAQIERDGLTVRSVRLGDFSVDVPAVGVLDEPSEVLVVATKSTGLRAALERVRVVPELVVPLLNGLDHIALLREWFGGDRVAAGTIRIESDRPAPGVIAQTSPFLRVELASGDSRLRASLERFAALLRDAAVPAETHRGEAQIMWSKLVRLNALACTTSAADRPVGLIRSDPRWRAALVGCIEEGAAVANADGARIDPAATLAELDDAHPELGSSMQRDIAAGREPELDAVAGAVLRGGARHAIECPTVARLAHAIAERAGVDPPRY